MHCVVYQEGPQMLGLNTRQDLSLVHHEVCKYIKMILYLQQILEIVCSQLLHF